MSGKSRFLTSKSRDRLVAGAIVFVTMLGLAHRPPFVSQTEAKPRAIPQVTVSVADFDPADFSQAHFAD